MTKSMSTLRVGVNVPPVPACPRLPPAPAFVPRGRSLHPAATATDSTSTNEVGRIIEASRQRGAWFRTAAVRSSTDPQLSEQAESTSPLLPKRWTKLAIRIAGSATWPSAAVHECAMIGHGPVSDDTGADHSTVYGEVGPLIAETRICWSGNAFNDRTCCVTSAIGISTPSSAGTQPSSVTRASTSPFGASRGGFMPLHRCPNSLQRKFDGGPRYDASLVFIVVS